MINLLPTQVKEDFQYAHRNTKLSGWATALLVALFGALLITIVGFLYLERSISNQRQAVEVARSNLNAKELVETQKKVEEISTNTKLATQVLSKEVLFSDLLRQLGATLPANTALTQLKIDQVQGGITLTATASDITSATQIQVNLQDPTNKIFEKADIESIDCTEPTPDQLYPCTVQIRALFAKDNPFLYITPTLPITQGATP